MTDDVVLAIPKPKRRSRLWRLVASLAAVFALGSFPAGFYAEHLFGRAVKQACKDLDDTRADARRFINESVSGAASSTNALLHNPNTTPAQRVAARRNLSAIQHIADLANKDFAHKACHA